MADVPMFPIAGRLVPGPAGDEDRSNEIARMIDVEPSRFVATDRDRATRIAVNVLQDERLDPECDLFCLAKHFLRATAN